jgi:hypothetical protein
LVTEVAAEQATKWLQVVLAVMAGYPEVVAVVAVEVHPQGVRAAVEQPDNVKCGAGNDT